LFLSCLVSVVAHSRRTRRISDWVDEGDRVVGFVAALASQFQERAGFLHWKRAMDAILFQGCGRWAGRHLRCAVRGDSSELTSWRFGGCVVLTGRMVIDHPNCAGRAVVGLYLRTGSLSDSDGDGNGDGLRDRNIAKEACGTGWQSAFYCELQEQ
jgi:hypothetical protein